MDDDARLPSLPRSLTDPRPPLAVGAVGWLVANIAVWLNRDDWAQATDECAAGLVVGVFALSVFLIQRRSARRGDKSAQSGLV